MAMTLNDLPTVEGIIRKDGKTVSVIVDAKEFQAFVRKCRVQGEIDEQDYIDRYSDVANAVKDGRITNASQHFIRTGYAEGRLAKPRQPA